MRIIMSLLSLFKTKPEDHVQTFTYFIPAPPSRKSGYREKNFDNLSYQLSNKGFRILDIKTQAISNCDQPGIFVILKIIPESDEAKNLSPSDFPQEFSPGDSTGPSTTFSIAENEKSIELPSISEDTEDLEGIYYID